MKTNHINSEPLHALTGRNIHLPSMSDRLLAGKYKSLVMTIFAIVALFQMVCLSTARATTPWVFLYWDKVNNYDLTASFSSPRFVKEGDSIDHIEFTGYTRADINLYSEAEGEVEVSYLITMVFRDFTGQEDVYRIPILVKHLWKTSTTKKTHVREDLEPGYAYLFKNETLISAKVEISGGTGYSIEGQKIQEFSAPVRARRLLADLDDDGDSDILWRNTNGMVHQWNLVDGIKRSGGNVNPTAVDTNWKIVDIDDMDKDGDGDLIWIHTDGSLVYWLQENGVHNSGGYITNGSRATTAGTGWNFVDVEDLDDDGDGDYIWRHTDGRLKYWLIQNGAIVRSADVFSNLTAQLGKTSAELTAAYKSWKIHDVEDLDFDGHADIVWRDTNSASGRVITMLLKNGVFAKAQYASAETIASSWRIVDVADMNSDGHADIIWRNDNGTMHSWIMRGGIRQSGIDMYPNYQLPTAWVVQSAVDFDGDGHGDILMRNTNGQVHGWRCLNGVRQSSFNVAPTATGLEWTINTHR